MDTIVVDVLEVNKKANYVTLESGATLEDLFKVDGITLPEGDYQISINGSKSSSMDQILKDGDTILIAKMVKGNAGPFPVTVRIIGRDKARYTVEPGTNLRTLLGLLDDADQSSLYDSDGKLRATIQVNGEDVDNVDSYILNEPTDGSSTLILIAHKVKGND